MDLNFPFQDNETAVYFYFFIFLWGAIAPKQQLASIKKYQKDHQQESYLTLSVTYLPHAKQTLNKLAKK